MGSNPLSTKVRTRSDRNIKKNDHKIELIIISTSIRYESNEIIKYCMEQQGTKSVIMFSSVQPQEHPLHKDISQAGIDFYWIRRPMELKILPSIVSQIKNKSTTFDESVVNFRPFPLEDIYKLPSTPVDVFVQINNKFVKIHHAESDLYRDDLKKTEKEKDQKCLYKIRRSAPREA